MIPGHLDKCVERNNCVEALGILSHRENLEEVFFKLP